MKKRYLKDSVKEDLADKMAFIGGPRQIGKTTFALSLLGAKADESSKAYLNWDYAEDREMILSGRLPGGQRLIVFDEIHKYSKVLSDTSPGTGFRQRRGKYTHTAFQHFLQGTRLAMKCISGKKIHVRGVNRENMKLAAMVFFI